MVVLSTITVFIEIIFSNDHHLKLDSCYFMQTHKAINISVAELPRNDEVNKDGILHFMFVLILGSWQQAEREWWFWRSWEMA
jgi:hypothetical protein